MPDHQKTTALRSDRSGDSGETQGKVLPFRLTERTIRRRAIREIQELYRITAGFTDPEPPSCEARQMLEEGWELP